MLITQPPKIVVKLLETLRIFQPYILLLSDSSSNSMYWSVIEKYYFTYFVSLQNVSSFAVFFVLICSPLCASASVVSCQLSHNHKCYNCNLKCLMSSQQSQVQWGRGLLYFSGLQPQYILSSRQLPKLGKTSFYMPFPLRQSQTNLPGRVNIQCKSSKTLPG